MGARFPTGFILYDEPYGHYMERYLNPDESASSLDQAREDRAADYTPAPQASPQSGASGQTKSRGCALGTSPAELPRVAPSSAARGQRSRRAA
jgi:hypothetical protein